MPKIIMAREGDCLINVSSTEGHFWETVWNHPQNAELRERREHLNIIKEGDHVFIPDIELKEYSGETERRHRFEVRGRRANFTLTLMNLGKPRANETYILIVDGTSRTGQTDENGTLSEPIPPKARYGRLLLGAEQEEFEINFGYMDPIEEFSGVQKRLQNLGFYPGPINNESNIELTTAIAEFQRSEMLSGEGTLNDETRQKLVEVHGS